MCLRLFLGLVNSVGSFRSLTCTLWFGCWLMDAAVVCAFGVVLFCGCCGCLDCGYCGLRFVGSVGCGFGYGVVVG